MTSGIFNIFLFNIIGASILPVNIVLIFNGSSFGLLISGIFISILVFGKSIFGSFKLILVSISGTFISPSILGIFILGASPSIFGALISKLGTLTSFSKLGVWIFKSISGIIPFIFSVILGALISIFGIFPSILGASISIFGPLMLFSIFGASISIFGIFL